MTSLKMAQEASGLMLEQMKLEAVETLNGDRLVGKMDAKRKECLEWLIQGSIS